MVTCKYNYCGDDIMQFEWIWDVTVINFTQVIGISDIHIYTSACMTLHTLHDDALHQYTSICTHTLYICTHVHMYMHIGIVDINLIWNNNIIKLIDTQVTRESVTKLISEKIGDLISNISFAHPFRFASVSDTNWL